MNNDPQFREFLKKLQEDNSKQLGINLLQLKSEKEIAGEDDDKREEQLDELIEKIKDVQVAITGIQLSVDFAPLVDIGVNQTTLLDAVSKEISLIRKLTEGSIEYDKEAAGYRNISGREIESVVSGKVIKKGGFMDFETARDMTAGQGKRATEANKINLKPISYVPGQKIKLATGTPTDETPVEQVNKNLFQNLGEEIVSGIKYFLTDGLSEKDKKEKRENAVSGDRQKALKTPDPNSDNITTAQETIADASSQDLEISKNLLETTKQQLAELKAIREALAPSTPPELTEQKSLPTPDVKEKETGFELPRFPKRGMGGKIGSTATRLGSGVRGAWVGGGSTIAAGAAMIAAPFAVDYGLGELGYGKNEINEKQDEANWQKMTLGEKIESGAARGLEKIGGLFGGTISNEARAARIKKETEYLEKKTVSSEPKKLQTEIAQLVESTAQVDAKNINLPNLVAPAVPALTGPQVFQTTVSNADMSREVKNAPSVVTPVINNSINSTNTTRYVPMKGAPRPEYTGSALDRYQNRISVF